MTEQTYIQGHLIGSQNELNVALALDKLNLKYQYQYPFGLHGTRGSQIIDFLVYTVPKPTPLFVHGEYWHKGKKGIEDELKLQNIAAQRHDQWHDPVIIWDTECDTFDDAYNNLRKILRL